MGQKLRYPVLSAAFALSVIAPFQAADAGSLKQALASAYQNNPTLNAARANVRAVDEGVPQALSAWRPRINASADIGVQSTSTSLSNGASSSSTLTTGGFGISIQQSIFRGFRTVNGTEQAEKLVLAARQSLKNTEQNTLSQAAEAYMNVLRDTTILALRGRNLDFLKEQVRAARDRFSVGEGTRTDVAQAEARQSAARSQVELARANLNSAKAVFRQVTGQNAKHLRAGYSVERYLPKTLARSLGRGKRHHPAIMAAQFNSDAAALSVKVVEGELLPTVTVEGNLARRYNPSGGVNHTNSASIVGRLSVPIYQGGVVHSRVRQAKERLGEARIQVDVARDQVRAAILSAWGGLEAARAQIAAAHAQVTASQLALSGVTEERRVGQRTTLDVLNAQQEVIDARIALVTAQRNRVVASFSLMSAIGDLNAQRLGLRVARYKPQQHYKAVRDKWFGLRTPDGR